MIALDAKVYLDPDGVGNGAYSEVTIVGEVTGDDSRTESEIKLRGTDDVLYEVGMRNRPVTFQILHRPDDSNYAALKTAYENKTDVGLAFLDEARDTGVKGWEGDYKIAQFSKPQPVDETWWVEVRAVPSVASGATRPRDYQHSA